MSKMGDHFVNTAPERAESAGHDNEYLEWLVGDLQAQLGDALAANVRLKADLQAREDRIGGLLTEVGTLKDQLEDAGGWIAPLEVDDDDATIYE